MGTKETSTTNAAVATSKQQQPNATAAAAAAAAATTTTTMSNTSTAPNSHLSKPYGKILLTLQNCLLPDDKLDSTPSSVDGLDTETETDLRILGCELIQTAGILLRLPQVSTPDPRF